MKLSKSDWYSDCHFLDSQFYQLILANADSIHAQHTQSMSLPEKHKDLSIARAPYSQTYVIDFTLCVCYNKSRLYNKNKINLCSYK